MIEEIIEFGLEKSGSSIIKVLGVGGQDVMLPTTCIWKEYRV